MIFGKKEPTIPPFDLSFELLNLHNAEKNKPDKEDVWRLVDAVRSVQVFGGIGSGKTTSSGRAIAHAYLNNGYGGIVLTGKVGEKKTG